MLKNSKLCLMTGIIWLNLAPAFAEITPQSVLGEYWKDPLFGVAAESSTVHIEVLKDRFWPETLTVPTAQIIRFVVTNKTNESHLIAFSNDIKRLTQDDKFKMFVADEVFHSQHKANKQPHNHSHSSNSVDEAEAIVKELEQRPTVMLTRQETKEILIRFNKLEKVSFSCVIEHGKKDKKTGIIEVVDNE